MLQLIFNPNIEENILLMEFIAHKFDDLDIELVPTNANNIILIKDHKIVANSVNEIVKLFDIEPIENKTNDTIASYYDNDKDAGLTIDERKKIWESEEKSELDKADNEYNEKVREYTSRRSMDQPKPPEIKTKIQDSELYNNIFEKPQKITYFPSVF